MPVDAGEPAHRVKHVGEVDAGCADRYLDLLVPAAAVERGEFEGFEITRCADLPDAYRRCSWSHGGGSALVGSAAVSRFSRAVNHSPPRQAVSSSSEPD